MVDVGLERTRDVPLAGREPLHAGQRLVARPLELLAVELLGEVGVGIDDADGRGAHAALLPVMSERIRPTLDAVARALPCSTYVASPWTSSAPKAAWPCAASWTP